MADVIVNGRSIAQELAAVSILDRGFRFGDGVFETIAVHDGVPYQFEWHIERMAQGLAAIKIAFDTSILKNHTRTLLAANQLTDGIVRIQVTRGIGSKGYLPDSTAPNAGPCYVLETRAMPAIGNEPVALWQSTYTKPSPKSLPVQFKLCQGLNSTLARMEAKENECADALLSNEQKHLCETSSGNLFWLKDKILYTPSLACGVLDGSMRSVIMRLSPWKVQEVEATAGQMTRADAVMISNVVWKVLPVGALKPQGIHWPSEAAAGQLLELINADIAQYTQKHLAGWR
jgi:branched-subunit amino acid aminotransferase/4-amino-4-deoxychorismate lyase